MGHTLTWEKGRQLKSFDGNTYTYNANGIRTSKTINGVKHTYTLDGTKILREAWGNERIIPLYDNEDSICGLIYGRKSSPEDAGYVEESFFFLKNLQGDIIAITDQNGRVVAKYAYDAWGKCTIVEDTSECGIATVNPFRYRGYYYDAEIGMYYLQSRYYDSVVGRFVNGDDTEYINDDATIPANNIFAYCKNDCVNGYDPTGHGAFKAIGVQFAMTWKRMVVGLEVLWDTSKWKPYFFIFAGSGSKNFLKDAEMALKEDLTYCLKKVPKGNLTSLTNKLSNFGFSLSFVAVFGNRHSKFPSTYTGWFTSASFSIKHVVVSGAVGYAGKAVIGSFALGITTSVLNASLSQTYYWQISKDTKITDFVAPLKDLVWDQMAWLQFFTFLLV